MRPLSFMLLLAVLLGLRLATLPVLPLVDPSEARYATVARDMLRSGNLVTPMVWANNDYVPFLSKPPLYYWLSAASMRVLGPGELATRLPSFLACVGVLASTWLVLRRRLPADVVRNALLILLSSPLFFFAAGFGLTDVVLCFFVSLALLGFYASTREEEPGRSRAWSLGVFACLGVGMLIKGPVSLVLFGLPAALWTLWKHRSFDLQRQPWLLGSLLFLLPWLPWYVIAEINNPGFLEYFFINENLLRYAADSYADRYGGGHRYPYGAAIVFLLLAILPWAGLLAWRIRHPDQRRQALTLMKSPALQFFAVVVGANVLFLCFSRHILGTYVLPVLPAAALLLAALLTSLGFGARRIAGVSFALVCLYVLALTLGLPLIEGRWSTKAVLDEARAIQEQRRAGGQIIFIEKIPFSARFYGGPEVFHLPWDAGNEHYEGYLEPAHGDLFVLNPTHGTRLDPYVTERLAKIADCGFYSIWKPVDSQEADAAPAPLDGESPSARRRAAHPEVRVASATRREPVHATLTGRSESRCFASSSALASASPSSVS